MASLYFADEQVQRRQEDDDEQKIDVNGAWLHEGVIDAQVEPRYTSVVSALTEPTGALTTTANQGEERLLSRTSMIVLSFLCFVLVGAGTGAAIALKLTQPEASPSPSQSPSAAPTSSPTLPNDSCDRAFMADADGSFNIGSTAQATVDELACGAEDTTSTSPGVWYKVEGTGEPLIFNTCSSTGFDTRLSVYKGNCESLVCVGFNDDYDSVSCGQQSRVTIDSETGTSYYVLVHGYRKATGDFSLQVATPETLYNDLCVDARTLPFGSFMGDTISVMGDNIYAQFDFTNTTFCDETVTIDGPTVWYRVSGTGGRLSASLCSPETKSNMKLSVYEGNCSDWSCIGGRDYSKTECGSDSEFIWVSDPSKPYHIAVRHEKG